MSLFTDLSSRHEEFLLDFIKWYRTKKYNIPVSKFPELDDIFQVVIFHIYVHEKFNIGIHFDEYTIILYWVKPDHKMAEVDILERFNKTGEFTHTFLKMYNLPKLNAEFAYKRAIIQAIEYIVEPF